MLSVTLVNPTHSQVPGVSLACYHCSQPCERDTPFTAELGGQTRLFCCSGCQAIAQTIHGQGLDMFYTRRVGLEAPLEGVGGDLSQVPDELLAYDDEALLSRFAPLIVSGSVVSNESEAGTASARVRQTTLRLEKIRCAACVWLNEQHWRQMPGVLDVQVNYVTQRARIRFDEARCRFSTLLYAARQIGYLAWPFDPSASADLAKAEQRRLLFRLGVALVGMMQVMMYAWPTYTNHTDMTAEQERLMGWAGWLLTLPVIFYSAWPMFSSAWHSVRRFWKTRTVGMDVPVAIALILAFSAGTFNLIHGVGQTYFDSITMFVALLLLARYVELRARHSAQGGAEALVRQLPATCHQVLNYGMTDQQVRIIPVVKVGIGESIRVSPGDVIPVDGELLSEMASLSEALLTGESKPVEKQQGSPVFAGSHNLANTIYMRSTAVGNATRMAGIAGLLEEALNTKPLWAGIAEKWAGYFVMLLLLLSFGTGLYWELAGVADAWVRAVAVLVVSCPCALSLAAPAALAAAQGAMTRQGLLVVKAHALDGLATANTLVLDKTGTITSGRLKVVSVQLVSPNFSQAEVLAIAAQLEDGQKHPVANALIEAASHERKDFSLQGESQYMVGHGISQGEWQLGSPAWIAQIGKNPENRIATDIPNLASNQTSKQSSGQTQVDLAGPEGIVAHFIFEDEVRQGADELVGQARAMGLRIHLISGDAQSTVKSWANRFNITQYRGGMLPEDKLAYIQALQKEGAKILAVGDGINDAPQLAQADVSIAVGQGAPLAQAGADIILVDPSLKAIAQGLLHAHRTRQIIRQNLTWALVYNLAAIPLAVGGWINPWIAGIGMSVSSLVVTLNAWRLRKI